MYPFNFILQRFLCIIIFFKKGTFLVVQWLRASQVVLEVKNPPVSARDSCSILGSGRSPGGGHGNPLPYSCLENPMDRGAWRATVHRVTKSRTQLKCLSMHAQAQVPSHLEFSRMLNTLDE